GDVIARAVTQRMSEAMGQPFVVENKPGAGGIVATKAVAQAKPDGYTLLLLNNGHAISESLFENLPYNIIADFEPVTTITTVSVVMLVAADSKIKNVQEFIKFSEATPSAVNLGAGNIGSTPNLAAELLKSLAIPSQTIVPFNNSGAVISALRGGQIEA